MQASRIDAITVNTSTLILHTLINQPPETHSAVGLQGSHRSSEQYAVTVQEIQVSLCGDQLGGHEQLHWSCVADSIATWLAV